MKKIVRLTESDLVSIVKRVIQEESEMSKMPNYKVGDKLKLKTGPNNSYVVAKITNSTFNEPGNVSYDFKVLKVVNTTKYKVGDSGNFDGYDTAYGYTIFFKDGSQFSGKYSQIGKL
jgi:hypothetical protein